MVHEDPAGTPGLLAYARVSTADQDPSLQLDALARLRPWRTYLERASGAESERPLRARLLQDVRPGDQIVVWRLDRWGRSLTDLIATVEELGRRGVAFRVLHGAPIDTRTPDGRLVFHLFAALAEFERALLRERSIAGQEAARRRGVRIGRPPVMDTEAVEIARTLRQAGVPQAAIARQLGVSRRTVSRYLDRGG